MKLIFNVPPLLLVKPPVPESAVLTLTVPLLRSPAAVLSVMVAAVIVPLLVSTEGLVIVSVPLMVNPPAPAALVNAAPVLKVRLAIEISVVAVMLFPVVTMISVPLGW